MLVNSSHANSCYAGRLARLYPSPSPKRYCGPSSPDRAADVCGPHARRDLHLWKYRLSHQLRSCSMVFSRIFVPSSAEPGRSRAQGNRVRALTVCAWSIILLRELLTCAKTPQTGLHWPIMIWRLPSICLRQSDISMLFSFVISPGRNYSRHMLLRLPRRSHQNTRFDLSREKCGLELPGTHLDFIGKINTASIPTRYPDDLQRSLKEYPKSVAKDYLNQTMELVQWLKQHPNLSES